MELYKTEKLNELFSYYHSLLTDKQVEYFKLYYYDDYSLSEIAEIHNVSRNAIYDQLKRVEARLNELEEKLELNKKAKKRKEYLDKYLKSKDDKYLHKLIEVDDENE